jgi:hypothetical protein
MVRYRDTLWCDGCGVEICWEPEVIADQEFCCKACSMGEKCSCEGLEEEYPLPDKNIKDTQYFAA